jgi:hypothetical protein
MNSFNFFEIIIIIFMVYYNIGDMRNEIIWSVVYDNYEWFLTCKVQIFTKFHFIISRIS